MRTLVIGAGVSGRAAADLAVQLGDDVLVFDRNPDAVAPLALRYPTASGAWSPDLLDRIDRLVVSPGVPEHAAEIRDALTTGIPVISEIELAAGAAGDTPIVAVTGTNGKTTVTSLIAEMLIADGRKATAAGNIGTPFSSVATDPWEVAVVEVSSFQLRFIDRFHPRIAVLLNIAEDHLDWHGTLQAYTAAKANIYRNQDSSDVLIYDIDDQGASAAAVAARSRLLPVSGTSAPPGGLGPRDSVLDTPAGTVELGSLTDPSFIVDVAAAAGAALELGAAIEAIGRVAATFEPGPHRRTPVGTWEGITWVDDSKATNPHAATAAAAAYPSVVLIAGGRNKGLDLTPLIDAPTVRQIVAIGESGIDLVAAAPHRVIEASDMDAAVEAAAAVARPGDTVLLAPGCASFDMFDSYAARGESFARSVRARHGVTA